MTVALEARPLPETAARKVEAEFFDRRSIGVATTTKYEKWFPLAIGAERDIRDIDGIRGDLALETLREAARNGFQVVVVDSRDSTNAFKEELARVRDELGISVQEEQESSMSAGRRQAFEAIGNLDGVKVISWIEPEKVSMVNNLIQAARPILNDEADIVIPARDERAFSRYPEYQVVYEKAGNRKFNRFLKEHELLPQEAPTLDLWFGPRLFKNDPDIRSLFQHTWALDHTRLDGTVKENRDENTAMDPELWPNATFLPIVGALEYYKRLAKKPRIVSMTVSYEHPEIQTKSETANTDTISGTFRDKRRQQFDSILGAAELLVQAFEYDRGDILTKPNGEPTKSGGQTLYFQRKK